MPRTVTVTLDDGSQHTYQNIPDDITPEQVNQRASSDFGKAVTHIDGGNNQQKPRLDDVPAPSNPEEFTAQQNAIKQPTYIDRVMDTGSQIGSFLSGLPKNALDTGAAIATHPMSALQAAGSILSAGTTGLFGQAAGFAHGLATGKNDDALAAEQASTGNNLTYTPSDPTAQRYVENVGKALEPFAGLMPATAEMGAIGQSAKAAIPKVVDVAKNEYDLIRPAKDIAKANELSLNDKLSNKINANFDEAIKEYNDKPDSMGGKIISTDVARELSPDYLKDRSLSADVHNASSKFAKDLYAKKLLEEPKVGEEPRVLFMAGGTGAGKSTAIKQNIDTDKYQIVYDTNMNSLKSSTDKIEQALDAGKDINIAMVHRDPIDALVNGALTRAERQAKEFGSGRTVPIEEHLRTHEGSNATIIKLAEMYKDDPRVEFTIIDNSKGKGNATLSSVDFLKSIDYTDTKDNLRRALDNEYKAGKISNQTYSGFNAKSDSSQKYRNQFGKVAEQTNSGQTEGLNANVSNITNDFTRPLSAKDTASRVAQIQPDKDLINAASKLDILDQTPAAILTSNPAAKELIGQLNAAGGNSVSESHIAFNKVLKDKANDLIKEANGDLDSASLNSNLHDEMNSAHDLIKAQVSNAYDAIDKNITKGGVVDARPMLRQINISAKDLENGVKDLSPVEQKVYAALSGKPTYANIDVLRKDIGHSLGTMNSTWGNTDKSILKKLYSGLSDLQEKAAIGLSDNPRIGQMWADAKELDKKKYALQDSIDFVFGGEKGDSITPKMDAALSLLGNKSNPKTFNNLIENIPEEHRGAVVATSLRNIMTGTIRGEEAANIGKFNTWYGNLERSPVLKRQLERYLPEGVPEKLQAYSKITRSFANNTAVPRTGIVKDIFKTEPNRIIDRLYGAIEGAGATGQAASKVGQFILKKSDPKAVVADNLLSSKEFKTAMLDYEKNKDANTVVQKKFQKNALVTKYLKAVAQPRLVQAGLMGYLMQQEEGQQAISNGQLVKDN